MVPLHETVENEVAIAIEHLEAALRHAGWAHTCRQTGGDRLWCRAMQLLVKNGVALGSIAPDIVMQWARHIASERK